MCLDKLDREPRDYGECGYKVVWNDSGTIRPEFKHGGVGKFRIGKWITDEPPPPDTTRYPMGFHIFVGFGQAKQWARLTLRKTLEVRKVWFKDIVCTGKQMVETGGGCMAEVIVARKIFIASTVLFTNEAGS